MVIIDYIWFHLDNLPLVQSLVKHSIADEVRHSGIVMFFYPLAYDFFSLGRETDIMKVFAVLTVFSFHDAKF